MTEEGRGIGGATGSSWSVDLLADLHAGVLDDRTAARLWPQVTADPQAQAIMDALDATKSDLADFGAAPVAPMPAHVARRLEDAIANEARQRSSANSAPFSPTLSTTIRSAPAQPQTSSSGSSTNIAPVISMDLARRRRKRVGWGVGVLAAAAAAVAAFAILVPGSSNSNSPNVAGPPSPTQNQPGVLALRGDGSDATLAQAFQLKDYGPLENQQKLNACLSAHGYPTSPAPVGVRPVTVDGQPGVLVVLTTGNIAQFRLVAFPATCGPGGPGPLFDKLVGK